MNEDIARSFQKIDDDLTFLMNCFREVLEELGEHDLASNLPWINQVKVDAEPNPRRCQAYSIAFQLLNMVEENVAAQVRRSRESEIGLSGEPGLWADHLRKMRESGIAETQIAEELNKIRIEPVLTAHPTEAKRLAVLEQHRALHGLIVGRENPMWTPLEQEEQGETITQKYANRSTATYNLELLLAGTQSRYYLPDWFGIGTALQRLQGSNPEGFGQVVELRQSYPFLRFVLTNAETNLASAERPLMEKYATLCPPEERVTAVFRRILEEFDLAQSMLREVLGGDAATRRPRFTKTHQMRADALLVLHTQQVTLLRDWRAALASGDNKSAERFLADLLVCINAIASSLRTTG